MVFGKNQFELAYQYFGQGNHDEAAKGFRRVLRTEKKNFAALNFIMISLTQLGRLDEAAKYGRRAAAHKDASETTHTNYGIVLKALGRHSDALEQFTSALNCNPKSAEGWNGRGGVYAEMRRYKDALADFEKALFLKSNYWEPMHNKATTLMSMNLFEAAERQFAGALNLNPSHAGTWFNYGKCLMELGRLREARAAFNRVLKYEPAHDEVWKILDNLPAATEETLATATNFSELHLRLGACDWLDYEKRLQLARQQFENGHVADPFILLSLPVDEAQLLKNARDYVQKNLLEHQPLWGGEIYQHDRVKVGFVSGDFHEHATAYLMAGLFEKIDKTRFEVFGLSLNRSDYSSMRARLEQAFEHFHDLSAQNDDEIAGFVKELEITILIDLKGYTANARAGIFARRPAPIQVNYLGFPGTLGADYMDYIIADRIVIPSAHRANYAEKVVCLPNCYQVNDSKREVSTAAVSREAEGLPDRAFVFCCFNNSYKIQPMVFDRWMNILRATPHSVLWLYQGAEGVENNLRREARKRGIDPARLVFAKHKPLAEHLARYPLADLFLDTWPYGAHTTASDALFMGVPVLTYLGDTFAGKVASSLLNAVGLTEFMMLDWDSYEATAILHAHNPASLKRAREILKAARTNAPLFDTDLMTDQFQTAMMAMMERLHMGLSPDHIIL